MKIRMGFVSNSSSSSFCVMGIVIDEEKFTDELMEKVENCQGLDYVYGISNYAESEVIIGLSVKDMKNEETLLDFKKRVLDDLKKIDIDVSLDKIQWRIDGGYEG